MHLNGLLTRQDLHECASLHEVVHEHTGTARTHPQEAQQGVEEEVVHRQQEAQQEVEEEVVHHRCCLP